MNNLLFNNLLNYTQYISDDLSLFITRSSRERKLFTCGFHINKQIVRNKSNKTKCFRCIHRVIMSIDIMDSILFNNLLKYTRYISNYKLFELLLGSHLKCLFTCGYHINYIQINTKNDKRCGKCVNQTINVINILKSLLFNNLLNYTQYISDKQLFKISLGSSKIKLFTCGNHINNQIVNKKDKIKCGKCNNRNINNTNILNSLLFNNLKIYTQYISDLGLFNLSPVSGKKKLFTCKLHFSNQCIDDKVKGNKCGKCNVRNINHVNNTTILKSLLFNNLFIYTQYISNNSSNITVRSYKRKLFTCGSHITITSIDVKRQSNCSKCSNRFIDNTNILNSFIFNRLLIYTQYISDFELFNLSPVSGKKKLFTCRYHINLQKTDSRTKYLNFRNCPECNYSKLENNCKYILNNLNIKFVIQKTFDDCKYKQKLKFDIYISKLNTLIELDGEQHFENVNFFGENSLEQNRIKDNIKNEYAKNNNIRLLRISYSEINNIEKHIVNFISSDKLQEFIGKEYNKTDF